MTLAAEAAAAATTATTTTREEEASDPPVTDAETIRVSFEDPETAQLVQEALLYSYPVAAAGSSRTTLTEAATASCSHPPFEMGDHVYSWRSLAMIPAVFQHHGIVLDVWQNSSTNEENDTGDCQTTPPSWTLQIADFGNNETTFGWKKKHGPPCGLRVYESPARDWHRVVYGARGFWPRRAGTSTAARCDAPGLVRARVQFLVEASSSRPTQPQPVLLPAYHVVHANCECVAVWCKTGTWGTVQATSWLAMAAAGQAKSAVTVAGMAASTQVTVPAAGLWGWLGYTTHVSLLSTQPYLVPAIAAYGIVTVGVPMIMLMRSKQKWKERTIALNEAFWDAAVEHADVFVECITNWSSQYEPHT
jgi:hypothetical protein